MSTPDTLRSRVEALRDEIRNQPEELILADKVVERLENILSAPSPAPAELRERVAGEITKWETRQVPGRGPLLETADRILALFEAGGLPAPDMQAIMAGDGHPDEGPCVVCGAIFDTHAQGCIFDRPSECTCARVTATNCPMHGLGGNTRPEEGKLRKCEKCGKPLPPEVMLCDDCILTPEQDAALRRVFAEEREKLRSEGRAAAYPAPSDAGLRETIKKLRRYRGWMGYSDEASIPSAEVYLCSDIDAALRSGRYAAAYPGPADGEECAACHGSGRVPKGQSSNAVHRLTNFLQEPEPAEMGLREAVERHQAEVRASGSPIRQADASLWAALRSGAEGWVSVRERLPAFGIRVLVNHIGVEQYSFASRKLERTGALGTMEAERQSSTSEHTEGYWTWYRPGPLYLDHGSVTHWMPLPAPPASSAPEPADCLCSTWVGKPNPDCPIHGDAEPTVKQVKVR